MRRTLVLLGIVALVALSVSVLSTSAGAGSRPECFGKPATIVGTNGNNDLHGTNGNDVIVGKGGNDKLDGKEGDDRLCGNDGNDELKGGPGTDKGNGGPGTDKCNNDIEKKKGCETH